MSVGREQPPSPRIHGDGEVSGRGRTPVMVGALLIVVNNLAFLVKVGARTVTFPTRLVQRQIVVRRGLGIKAPGGPPPKS